MAHKRRRIPESSLLEVMVMGFIAMSPWLIVAGWMIYKMWKGEF